MQIIQGHERIRLKMVESNVDNREGEIRDETIVYIVFRAQQRSRYFISASKLYREGKNR